MFILCKGKSGLKYFDENRVPIMIFAAFCSILGTILSIVAVVAASYDTTNVENTCWTYGESESGYEVFVGLNMIVSKDPSGTTISTGWNQAECSTDYCDSCKTVCLESVSFAVMNLITTFPNIKGNLQRMSRAGDRNCEKNFAVVTGVLSVITSLISLSVYANGCARDLPDEIAPGDKMTYKMGPGYVSLVAAIFLLPINVIVNLLTPVPGPEEDLTKSVNSSSNL